MFYAHQASNIIQLYLVRGSSKILFILIVDEITCLPLFHSLGCGGVFLDSLILSLKFLSDASHVFSFGEHNCTRIETYHETC